MNANELADALQETEPYYSTDYKLFDQASTMLREQQRTIDGNKRLINLLYEKERQQADRIGVLEANHKIQLDINEKALQYIEQLEQGLRASINLNKAQNK